jgi:hypothetical protein
VCFVQHDKTCLLELGFSEAGQAIGHVDQRLPPSDTVVGTDKAEAMPPSENHEIDRMDIETFTLLLNLDERTYSNSFLQLCSAIHSMCTVQLM